MNSINWWEFETSYELPTYVRCKGGGGGGSSGKVSYPAYMETIHEAWLGASGDVSLDLTSAITAAHGNSPFDGAVAFDPSTETAAMLAALSVLAEGSNWSTVMNTVVAYIDNNVIDESYIDDASDAQSDYLDDEYTNNILPEFESGMRDINAVLSSSFVLGKAYIMAMKVRDVAKHRADLDLTMRDMRNKMITLSADTHLKDIFNKMSWDKEVAHLTIEANRIKLVAGMEEANQNLSIDENDAKWDLTVFQYGANMMGAVSGGVAPVTPDQPSQLQSAIGGAMAGASMGAATGNPYIMAAGAVIGFGASYM